jgi:hypothetical protein
MRQSAVCQTLRRIRPGNKFETRAAAGRHDETARAKTSKKPDCENYENILREINSASDFWQVGGSIFPRSADPSRIPFDTEMF